MTLLALASLAACTAGESDKQASVADLVIRDGILLDMVSDAPEPRPIRALVVRGGRIDAIVGADSAEPVPEATTVIDAQSGFILPGFIDAHVHFRPFVADASIWKRASNHYGITTLFDTGPCGDSCAETGQDASEWIAAYKAFMNDPARIDGPTLYITGRRIQDLDGEHPLGERLNSREEIAAYLDTLVEFGVDGVKVESTLPPDLRAAVVEEAGARGLPVVGHSRDAFESIAAGMKFIEHMWPITSSTAGDPDRKLNSPQDDHLLDLDNAQQVIDALVANGVYVNATLFGRYGYFAEPMQGEADRDFESFEFGGLFSDLPAQDKQQVRDWWARPDNIEPDRLESYRRGYASVEAFLKRFTDAGGRVVVATDSGEDRLVGIGLHREMHMLAAAGVTPYRVLLAATRWSAEMMGKDDAIGTLETGKRADIVIVGADPTIDIGHGRDIRYVIKSGTVLRSPADCSVILPPVSMTCPRQPSAGRAAPMAGRRGNCDTFQCFARATIATR